MPNSGKPSTPHERVVLAISAFRNDQEVLESLAQIAQAGHRFAGIVVVDSLGTGELPKRLESAAGQPVTYHCAAENLGAAGNLAKRLELAAGFDADWMLALNHDGRLERGMVEAMVGAGTRLSRPGAVYPLRQLRNREGAYDLTGTLPVPIRARRVRQRPGPGAIRVSWSSSNGALYHLEPSRRGIQPPVEYWHGYEDLGYGWRLDQANYEQVICTEAVFQDPYEFKAAAGGLGPTISDKPAWTAYYHARNLWRAASETGRPGWVRGAVLARLLAEVVVTTTLRSDKRGRLAYLASGFRDGVLRRGGKWILP